MFRDLFTTYYDTDPPPIITNDHKIIRDTYNSYIAPTILPSTRQEENISFSEGAYEYAPLKVQTQPIEASIILDEPQKSSSEKVTTIRRVSNQNYNNFIIDYFVDKGLTRTQAKGIYGNIMQESGGNIKAVSTDGNNSYGLAQWTGKRKQRLFSMYGPNPTINQQLDFLWWELNNTHKDALLSLKKTATVSQATKVFMDKFERPHKNYANFNRRLKYANLVT